MMPRCFTGTIDSLLRLPTSDPDAPGADDLVLVQCCANPGETADEQFTRFSGYFWQLVSRFTAVRLFGYIPFVRTNFVLSDVDVANNLIACSQLGFPVAIFEDLRPVADVPAFVPDWLAYWRNGQPAPVQVSPIPPTPPGLAAILKRKAMPMSYPPLAGFTKRQFQPDHEGNGNLNLVVTNPLPVAYDSGPPAGTVLPPARANITPAQVAGKCLLCVDPGGHWSAMPFGWTTDGIGTYGWWKLDGNLASVAPRGEGDQAFTFAVGD